MNQWLNYSHLYYFKVIAEEGSISRAAEKLRLGQPTLSAQLKTLEEALDTKLFTRIKKRLILTQEGRLALDYARTIFKMGDELLDTLKGRAVPARIHLYIGAIDSIPKQVLLQLVSAAYKIGPCTITLVEGTPDELLKKLFAQEIDLFVSNFLPKIKEQRMLTFRRVSKKNVSIYGGPRFRALRAQFPKSLTHQPFVLPTFDSKLRQDIESWVKEKKIDIDIVAESQDVSLTKLMAVNQLGLVAVASHAVARQTASGDLIEIGVLDGISEELFLISAQRRVVNPVAKQLLKSFSL